MPQRPPRLRRLLAALLATCAVGAGAAGTASRLPLVTVLDGEATLLRDGARYALAEGVRLQAGDLLATGHQTRLLCVEFPGGPGIGLGPDSRAMVTPNLGDNSTHAGVYLLTGWAKVAAPAGGPGAIRSPVADTDTAAGTLILDVQGGAAQAFAESGPSRVQPRAPEVPAQALKSGDMLAVPAAGKPVLSRGASQDFVHAMPRAFMDALPARLAAFSADAAPRRLGDMSYADAQPWIDAEAPLRHVFAERWRRLAADPQFRSGLVEGLKSHPEWTPILYPSGRVPPAAAKP
jgi:hypothetical protein